jgi:putative membrane protein
VIVELFLDSLPHFNALCNMTTTILLIVGYSFIRRGRESAHRNVMLAAIGSSALFLISYLTRYYLEGTHYFQGEGLVRIIYLTVLFSHMILAALVVPLVIVTVTWAFKGRFENHKAWARWTLPIWLYVSVTGLFVYVMLYWLYPV